MQIKRLEGCLGVALFIRTKAHVNLSASGEAQLGYAQRILILSQEAVIRLRECAIEGLVRLGVMNHYGSLVVRPLLSNFASTYPGIKAEMEIGLTANMAERLGEGLHLVIAKRSSPIVGFGI